MDTDAVLRDCLGRDEGALSSAVEVPPRDKGSQDPDGIVEEDSFVDEGDPMPPPAEWCPGTVDGGTAIRLASGPGRPLSSGLQVRPVLGSVATVLFSNMFLGYLSPGGNDSIIGRPARMRVRKPRRRQKKISDKKLARRVFSLAPHGSIGLVANFDRSGPVEGKGQDHSAAIEVSLRYDGVIRCACSGYEQCLRSRCFFYVAVLSALPAVATACRLSNVELEGQLFTRLPSLPRKGEGRMCGDGVCVAQGVGGSSPWTMVGKSRAKVWRCLTCVEQGIYCTHAPAARIAKSGAVIDAKSDESDPQGVDAERTDEVT